MLGTGFGKVLVQTILALMFLAAFPASALHDFGSVDLGEMETICVIACFGVDCEDSGPAINSIATEAPFFVRRIRRANFSADPCGTAAGEAVELPAALQSGEALVFDIDFVATEQGFFSEPLLVDGVSNGDLTGEVGPAPPCAPSEDDLLCLQNDRFTVRTKWRYAGQRGQASRVQGVSSADSGLFYFFRSDNWEMLLKVLDGCSVNQRFWVFSAATTNLEYTLTVTDTEKQVATSYFVPQGPPPPPILDTNALATCP